MSNWVIAITIICMFPIAPAWGRGAGVSHYGAGSSSYGQSYTIKLANSTVTGLTTTTTVHSNPGPVVHGSNPSNHAPFHNPKAAGKIYNLQPSANGNITLPSR